MSRSGRRVAITGISTFWGTELARRLERDPEVDHIVGIDSRPPAARLERTEFIDADLRSTVLARLLPTTGVETVAHCGILWYPEPGRPARVLHEINVIGTLQLLAACERADTVRHVVVRGSAAIYGCEGASPYFFTEELARAAPLRTRFQRDISELEEYFENFARRRPDLVCCMLRYQPEIGPGLDSPLVRYLTLPVVPVELGFDPRLQLVHADDATGAIEAAVRKPVRGAVNVAPSGEISLSRILRLCGRPALPVPHPLFDLAMRQVNRRLGAGGLVGDGVRLLRYGRGVDNRRLREEIGFEPRYDAVAAVRDLAAKTRARRLAPGLGAGALVGRLTETRR
jgi:UDP-glucose 4-epimerase